MSQTTQVPETIGGTVPHETIADAMREDGFLPPKAMPSPETITIEDVGPVRNLSIPILPGVVVLVGPNGSGKTLTLEATSRLLGGNGSVTCRDKAAAGLVEGLGVKISVRQSARRSGELEALSIEGGLSIADLVSPPIKDPVAADKHRIKALLQLTGVEADIGLFDAPRDLLSAETLKADDLVEMAARVKRDMESASRRASSEADKAEALAMACKQATEEMDLDVETDANILQAALEDAIYAQGEIEARASTARAAKDRARLAAERLASEKNPPNVEKAEIEFAEAAADLGNCRDEIERLKRELAKAEQDLKTATMIRDGAEERMNLERAHAESIKGWKETIAAGEAVDAPSETAIAGAGFRVKQCREDVERGAVARAAVARAAEARKHFDAAKEHRKAAESLREAARATDDVLSHAVASDSLTVKGGRLVTQHPERGETYYAECSDGERWKMAIDEAIKRIRLLGAERTAIIPIPQAAWSELQPKNKMLVHEYAKRLNVTIITAEATDDEEICAEQYVGAKERNKA